MIRFNTIFVLACVLSCGYGMSLNSKNKAEEDYEFICQQTGMFPDAYDCRKYYICVPDDSGTVLPGPTEYECFDGFSYDPETHLCSGRISGECPAIVGACNEEGDMGPVVGNEFMYYKCLSHQDVILPQMLKCEMGQRFINMECRDRILKSGLDEDGICNDDGRFPDHDDCTKYNDCAISEEPISGQCPPGQRYDGWEILCVPFVCRI